MGTPFRARAEDAIRCPRCSKVLPPRDVAPCEKGCGTWVTAFAASEVLTATDRTEDSITRWWKVRAPCPHCREQMTLRGAGPGLLQGCDVHGFWIDADAVRFTGLRAGVDETALEAKRADTERVDAERAARYALERERAQRRAELERLEAELDRKLEPKANPYAPELTRDDSIEAANADQARLRDASERENAARAEATRQAEDAERKRRRAYEEWFVTALRGGNEPVIADEVMKLVDRVAELERKLARVEYLVSEGRTSGR